MKNKILPEQFGEKLKILRKGAKFTQEAFSEKIGIEPQNLSRIERGLNFPSLATFLKISEVLNISPNDLLDIDYMVNEKELEQKINCFINKCTLDEKRMVYRILKVFTE